MAMIVTLRAQLGRGPLWISGPGWGLRRAWGLLGHYATSRRSEALPKTSLCVTSWIRT